MTSLESKLVDIVIEWTAGAVQRYEWFETTDSIAPVSVGKPPPPEHYGCVPGAISPGDGELLDVFLLDRGGRAPNDRVHARLIGVLVRSDGDHKLVAVDPAVSDLANIDQIPTERIETIWNWMRKHVRLSAEGPDRAHAILADARRAWQHTKEQ